MGAKSDFELNFSFFFCNHATPGGIGDGDDVAVDADGGRAGGIASDDEAGSDGRDDTRAYDANNQKHGASSSESESEEGSDDCEDSGAK